jgi:hypothetical protein
MRRGVSILGSILSVVLCTVLAACGATSKSGNVGANATMQAGQWEFVATPTSGGPTQYLEANLADSGGGVFSTPSNALVFWFEGTTPETCAYVDGGTPGGLTVSGTISGNQLSGFLNPGGVYEFSGAVAANGQSVSGGTFGGFDTCPLPGGGNTGTPTSGTFTGVTVSPLSGTFAGTLNGSISGPLNISMSVVQNANFDVTASGTASQGGCTYTLTFGPPSNGVSNVVGATLQMSGTGTSASVCGTVTFGVVGHFNQTATQIQILATNLDPNDNALPGTLTKQ